MLRFLILALSCTLSACMVGPNYKEPKVAVAPHWPKKDSSVKEAPYLNALWWKTFNDPTLTQIIDLGYKNNLPLQTVGVKVLQARAQLAQSVGMLYPQQQALVGNYNYNRIGGGSLQQVLPPTFLTAIMGFTATWELDFWGKYRRAVQANNAMFLSSLAAYDNALIILTADVAGTYIRIRTLEEQIQVIKSNIEVQNIALKIAKSRFKEGQTSLVDVEQAQTELFETEGTLPTYLNDLQRQKDALALLLGTIPGGVDLVLGQHKGIPKAPNKITVGIPKETLANRPDVYEAREKAIAEMSNTGSIKANLYPALSLAGTFIFASNNIGTNAISDIFRWQNRAVTAGPAINWPILNYGQITNAVRAQDAISQEALLDYMNLVLKAQQEVQDNISAYLEAKKATDYLSKANQAAIQTLKLTMIRYKEGETDFTPVLNAEQQILRVQLSLVNAQGSISQALVALYRALGGGWQIRNGNDIVSDEVKDAMAQRVNWGPLLQQQSHQPAFTPEERFKQFYLPTW